MAIADLFDQETLGSELILNGDFSAWTADDPDSWIVIEAGDATSNITENPSGQCQIISDGTNTVVRQNGILTIGKIYKITIDIKTVTSGVIRFTNGAGVDYVTINSIGVKTFYIIATTVNIGIWDGGVCDVTVDDVSVKEVTAPAKGIPENDPWPALAGAEAITDSDDRDFAGGDIGNWTILDDSTDSTVTYSAADLDGADDKQMLITVDETTDPCSFAYAQLATSEISLTTNTLYKISAKVYVPAENTLKSAKIAWNNIDGEIPATTDFALGDNAYETISAYVYLAADIVGWLLIGFNGNPADGDLMYIDDISIRPVQFSWVPYGTDIIEIDEINDDLLVTYVNNANGAYLLLADSADLSGDLSVGSSYLLSFYGSVGSGDTVTAEVLGQDGTTTLVDSGNIAESRTLYKLVFNASHATGDRLRFTGMAAGDVVHIDTLVLYRRSTRGLMRMGMSMTLK